MRFIRPVRLLTLYAVISACLLAVAVNTTGMTAVVAMMLVPFFMSIMFPTIFDLGIKHTGEMAKLGSSLLVMSIVGGAIVPLIMGRISDATHSIQLAFYAPLVCFLVVALYGWKGTGVRPHE
jgi:FHS family L-fucose permease-like MFS transporter